MDLEKAARETAHQLYTNYLKAPTVVYSINKSASRFNVDVVELSDFMLEKGWIRERWVYPDNLVTCRITIAGIEEVDAAFVRSKLKQLVGGLGEAGGSRELIEILEFKIEEYSIALDVVKQLEALGLVHLQHPKGTIIVELTEDGWRYFEKGSKTFYALATLA